MRLIDAIALISKAQRMETTDNNGIPVDTFAVPVMTIEDAPTVDAVEVVRCKDCINAEYFNGVLCCAMAHDVVRQKNDFCSYGERKDDGN